MYHLLRSSALPDGDDARSNPQARSLRNLLTIFLVSFLPLSVFAAQDCVTSVGATTMSVASPVCSGTSVTFSATASVKVNQTRGTINYQLYLNGTAISGATGSQLTNGSTAYVLQVTYAVKTSGTYTIVVTSNACTGQSVASSSGASLTVNQPSVAPTSLYGAAFCGGNGTNLGQNGGMLGTGATWKWYADAAYTQLVGSSTQPDASLVVYPTQTTTYYLRAERATAPCTTTIVEGGSVTVNTTTRSADPTSATASSLSTCSGQLTTLSLIGGGGGTDEVIKWYTGSCGGTEVGTGNNLVVNPTTTTTYYGRYEQPAPCNYRSICQSVTITVNPQPVITGQPSSTSVCAPSASSFTATASSTGTLFYQWQLSTDGGSSYNNVVNGGVYSGATTKTLTISNSTGLSGNKYRLVASGSGGCLAISNGATLSVYSAPAITTQPQSVSACANSSVNITVTATGSNLTYQWQVNTSGNTWSDITNGGVYNNATTSILSINATSSLSGNRYRVVISGQSPCGSVTSSAATLTVTPTTTITAQPAGTSACTGADASFSVSVTGTGLTYQWQMSADGGATYGNVPENSTFSGTTTSHLMITGVTPSMNGYLFRVLVNGTCGNVPSFSAMLSTTGGGYTWSGSINSKWSEPRNWSCGVVPNSDTADVIIVSTTNPAVVEPNATYTIRNITLVSGARVNLNGALNINGSINNNGGSFNGANGTINMKGSAMQSIAGSYFVGKTLKGLTVSNPVEVTLMDSIIITDVLNVASGIFNAASQSITLRSTALNTARIAPVNGQLRNASNVTVERYIPSERRAYRILAPSVTTSGSMNKNWQEGAHNLQFGVNVNPKPGYGMFITGNGGAINQFDETRTNQPSVYTYDATSLNWVPIPHTNSIMTAKTGYLAFVRGDRSIDLTAEGDSLPTSATTLRTTGTVQVGDQVYANLAHGDYSLVANPYPSPINWASIYANNNNTQFDNYYTYWDPAVGTRGGYVTVTSGGVNSAGTNATIEIQSGQAVFVHSKNAGVGSYDLTIRESDKSTTSNINVFTATTAQPKLHTSLYYNDAQGIRQIADGTLLRMDGAYSRGVDEWDALEIANWDENIAWTISNNHYSIQAYPYPSNDTLKMYMSHMKVRGYQLQFNPDNMDGQNFNARLFDKFTNTSTPVSMSGVTIVPFSVTSDPASAASDRFSVIFSTSGALPVTFSGIKAQQENKGVKVEWFVSNQVNADHYEVERSTTGAAFTRSMQIQATGNASANYNWFDANPSTGANFYRVKMIDKSGAVAYSAVAKVNISNGRSGVAVYPNPIHGSSITVQLTDLAAGIYNVRLIDNTGSLVYSSAITHIGGSATQTFNLNRSIAAGTYQLTVGTYTMQLIKK